MVHRLTRNTDTHTLTHTHACKHTLAHPPSHPHTAAIAPSTFSTPHPLPSNSATHSSAVAGSSSRSCYTSATPSSAGRSGAQGRSADAVIGANDVASVPEEGQQRSTNLLPFASLNAISVKKPSGKVSFLTDTGKQCAVSFLPTGTGMLRAVSFLPADTGYAACSVQWPSCLRH
jgi:hypothetical protein